MAKYRKKPVVVEAEQFTSESKDRVFAWISRNKAAGVDLDGNPTLQIQTLEGVMTANLGDWIIKGVAGEFYPCRPDIFEQAYESVED